MLTKIYDRRSLVELRDGETSARRRRQPRWPTPRATESLGPHHVLHSCSSSSSSCPCCCNHRTSAPTEPPTQWLYFCVSILPPRGYFPARRPPHPEEESRVSAYTLGEPSISTRRLVLVHARAFVRRQRNVADFFPPLFPGSCDFCRKRCGESRSSAAHRRSSDVRATFGRRSHAVTSVNGIRPPEGGCDARIRLLGTGDFIY